MAQNTAKSVVEYCGQYFVVGCLERLFIAICTLFLNVEGKVYCLVFINVKEFELFVFLS